MWLSADPSARPFICLLFIYQWTILISLFFPPPPSFFLSFYFISILQTRFFLEWNWMKWSQIDIWYSNIEMEQSTQHTHWIVPWSEGRIDLPDNNIPKRPFFFHFFRYFPATFCFSFFSLFIRGETWSFGRNAPSAIRHPLGTCRRKRSETGAKLAVRHITTPGQVCQIKEARLNSMTISNPGTWFQPILGTIEKKGGK